MFAAGNADESEPTTSTFSFTSLQWSQPCRHFEFPEILLATNNFDESLVIGHGGFGNVYRGTLFNGSSPLVVAIKRLDSMSSQGASEFWAEVEMLSRLRHCHLVSLIGYCNHEKEMILVYEYMPHGTLADHLHKRCTALSWHQRLKICIGAARGLDYLHNGTGIEFGIIHRDVKTSNILLHESWAAKISDFGLSKIGQTNQPSTYVNTQIKGTFGYFDPNYFATGKLSRKSDVYAFGVVLFEVLCRRSVSDQSLEWGFTAWAQDCIKKGHLKNIIDTDIRDEISPKCLKGFVEIAERCLDNHPMNRPAMAEVVFILESLLSLHEKTSNSLQNPGKTIFGRMFDMFPIPLNGENSGMEFGFLNPWKKKQVTQRKKFLEENGGLILEDKLTANGNIKVFQAKELKKATNSYSKHMIIGQGGSGIVYKGILEDNRVVAIKKSKLPEPAELERFINEIIILGQIIHPNIVPILGCCLETDVPVLVYEFVSNGTLNDHIQSRTRILSWDNCLRIAQESADALAYLHSLASMPIIHRDVKSSNIMLDEKYTAKIMDFGNSKSLPLDVDTVTTQVVGTFGYLDPEYFQTSQLTDKSDVYSFGVVLAELLTRRKPIFKEIDEEYGNLATCFMKAKSENRWREILDTQVMMEATEQQLKAACELVYRCLEFQSKSRPSMKEVTMELQHIKEMGTVICIECSYIDQSNY